MATRRLTEEERAKLMEDCKELFPEGGWEPGYEVETIDLPDHPAAHPCRISPQNGTMLRFESEVPQGADLLPEMPGIFMDEGDMLIVCVLNGVTHTFATQGEVTLERARALARG